MAARGEIDDTGAVRACCFSSPGCAPSPQASGMEVSHKAHAEEVVGRSVKRRISDQQAAVPPPARQAGRSFCNNAKSPQSAAVARAEYVPLNTRKAAF